VMATVSHFHASLIFLDKAFELTLSKGLLSGKLQPRSQILAKGGNSKLE
jgi:hypothetical protein